MNDKFDELTKGLAQSVTRRGALKNFGVGLAGIAMTTLGLAQKAEAGTRLQRCINQCKNDCAKLYQKGSPEWESCWIACAGSCPTI